MCAPSPVKLKPFSSDSYAKKGPLPPLLYSLEPRLALIALHAAWGGCVWQGTPGMTPGDPGCVMAGRHCPPLARQASRAFISGGAPSHMTLGTCAPSTQACHQPPCAPGSFCQCSEDRSRAAKGRQGTSAPRARSRTHERGGEASIGPVDPPKRASIRVFHRIKVVRGCIHHCVRCGVAKVS